MKYFYAAVIDGYQYSEVSEVRYKNFVDFAIHALEDCIEYEFSKFIKEDIYEISWETFFEDYYGYSTYYFALDEEGNQLEDLEDNDITFEEYFKIEY